MSDRYAGEGFGRYVQVALPAIPPALKLLAACAARRSATRDLAVREAMSHVAATGRWSDVAPACERHRMASTLYSGLSSALESGVPPVEVPAELLQNLRERAHADSRSLLSLIHGTRQILAMLEGAGIEATVLKGPPLSVLAFGDAGARQSRDLDLLVERSQMRATMHLLRERGFHIMPERLGEVDGETFERWLDFRKDYSACRAGSLPIEVHCRLMNNVHFFPQELYASARTLVEVMPGVTMPALGGEPLLLYLCVHGAHHRWERLKWLADVAALLADHDDAALFDFHARAASVGLDRPVGQALLLVGWMFDRPLSPDLLARITHDGVTLKLFRAACERLLDPREYWQHNFETTRTAIHALGLRREMRYRLRHLLNMAVDADRLIEGGGGRFALGRELCCRPVEWLRRKMGPGHAR